MAVEEVDRAQHHRAEDQQREEVEHRLRDDRAEDRGQVVARAAGAPGDDQRTRRLAEAGGQRGRHEHADERPLQRVAERDARAGQRGLEDRVPGDGADGHRGAHQRQPGQHPGGRGVEQRAADLVEPDALERRVGEEDAGGGGEHGGDAAQRGERGPAAAGLERWLGAGQALGRDAGTAVGGNGAEALGGTAGDRERHAGRDGELARLGVGVEHLAGDVGPGVALGALAGRAAELGAAGRVLVEVAQRAGQRGGVAAGDEHAVAAVAQRRRGSRRCPRRRRACRGRRPRSGPCRSSPRRATARRARRRRRARPASPRRRPCRAPRPRRGS